ncbi:hypothetical protein V6N12_030985 [Hibiscus sabdariffa]|uniref:Uncharacterized protein n=1 Tax=Hibiscus sabdariffa TaxID=183260 RepID=A0ABR2E7L4_9ROSI
MLSEPSPPDSITNSRPNADPPDCFILPPPDATMTAMDVFANDNSPLAPASSIPIPACGVSAVPPVGVATGTSLSPPSYKDTLMATESLPSPGILEIVDEEEVVLLEGDVLRTTVDGMIFINFSKRVHVTAVKNFDLTVVLRTGLELSIMPLPLPVTEAYGPWMMVDRHQRCSPRKATNIGLNSSNFVINESRFNPIFEDEYVARNGAVSETIEPLERHETVAHVLENQSFARACGKAKNQPSAHLPVAPLRGKYKIQSEPCTTKNHASPAVPITSVQHTTSILPDSCHAKKPASVLIHKPLRVHLSTATSSHKSATLTAWHSLTLSSARFAPFLRSTVKVNRANHIAVVLSENDDPNIPQLSSIHDVVLSPSKEPPGIFMLVVDPVMLANSVSPNVICTLQPPVVSSPAHTTSVHLPASSVQDQ